jgi:hypothetical protein
MADRTEKNIEDVQIGEIILGFDGHQQVNEIVLDLEAPVRDHYYTLVMANGIRIKLTREHPLFTQKGWASLSPKETLTENPNLVVNTLEIGDKILYRDGKYVAVLNIIFVPGNVKTYNLKKVSGFNNFYADGFLAHNKADSLSTAVSEINAAGGLTAVGTFYDAYDAAKSAGATEADAIAAGQAAAAQQQASAVNDIGPLPPDEDTDAAALAAAQAQADADAAAAQAQADADAAQAQADADAAVSPPDSGPPADTGGGGDQPPPDSGGGDQPPPDSGGGGEPPPAE